MQISVLVLLYIKKTAAKYPFTPGCCLGMGSRKRNHFIPFVIRTRKLGAFSPPTAGKNPQFAEGGNKKCPHYADIFKTKVYFPLLD